MRLFAFLFIPAKSGWRKIFGKRPSPYLRPPLTRAEWDRRKVATALYISRASHIPDENNPVTDESIEELIWLATSPDRYCPSLEEVDQIEREFDAIHGKRPESEYPIPRSVWTRLVGWWKKLLMGVRVQ